MSPRKRQSFSLTPLWVSSGVILLTISNWRLVLSTIGSIGLMALVYNYPSWNRFFNLRLGQLWNHPNRRLAVAVLSGAGGIFVCYLLLMIVESDANPWVGLGHFLQLLATFGTLGLALYHFIGSQRSEQNIDGLMLNLASSDVLTRMIVLRQLQQKVIESRLSFREEQNLKEACFFILLQETPPALQTVALETIDCLQYAPIEPKYLAKQPLTAMVTTEIA